MLRARYGAVFRHSWQHRRSMDAPRFTATEAEFLPAVLSLQAKPVSPVGRWLGRILLGGLVMLLAWSIFGKLDIVISAPGKIITSERTKVIASVEVASVRAVHVKEGQFVRAGELLVELDTAASDSERDKAQGIQQMARLQEARAHAMLKAIDAHQPPQPLLWLEDVPLAHKRSGEQFVLDQWRDYAAKLARFDSEISRYAAEVPLADERARNYEQLAAAGDVSRHAYLEKQQALLELRGQLSEAVHQRAMLTAEARKVAQESLHDAEKTIRMAAEDARRAGEHSRLLKLISPVDGIVQQLALHTVGGVVPAAQPLMLIVPEHAPLEVEAMLENKDAGFVEEGQLGQVKIDAYEFNRYGTLAAHVRHISKDSIQDEKHGLVYSILMIVDDDTLRLDGKSHTLKPGMAVTVDIKTGTRRVIEYLLSPILTNVKESLRER